MRWIDAAHQRICAGPLPVNAGRELWALLATRAGRGVLAALIRPSADQRERSYPICAFASYDAQAMRPHWHLVPPWLEPLRDHIAGSIFNVSHESRDALEEALRMAVPELSPADELASHFAKVSQAEVLHPWGALTGADDQQAPLLARSFAHITELQRNVRAGTGLVIHFPVSGAGYLDAQPAVLAAAWVKLLSAACASGHPWPAVVMSRERETASAMGLYVFGRPPTPQDLADLLCDNPDAAVEDVAETYQVDGMSEAAERMAERLLDDGSRALVDLWSAAT